MALQTLQNYIDGRFADPVGGAWLDDIEPATGQVFARLPDSDGADIDLAVAAAARAFPRWSATAAEERSRWLLRIADGIQARLEQFVQAESRDTGKPLALARSVDIPRAVANFRFFATAILHDASAAHITDHTALNYTLRRPRGVAGLISPWNLPLYLLSWKIAPALATGNTAVAKPSEITPLTAHLLAELCVEIGLPPGVLNVVHGTGPRAGAALVAHGEVPTISFTGGTATGRAIAGVAAPMFKSLSLELGGKNPTIVFADADLDKAIATSARAAFTNQGQICLCGARIFVEESIYAPFRERLMAAARKLRVGDPLDAATDQGALVSQAHHAKVLSYVQLARQEGGTILTGGRVPPELPERVRQGFFLEPTLIEGLAPTSRTMQEEIFGPVATLTPFTHEAEVVGLANNTPYGLSASVWTENLSRALRVAERLDSGTVWVNCWLLRDLRVPFGGMKQSGVGREGGTDALHFFTEAKNVCIRTPSGGGE